MKAMILAAGRGKRMMPLTATTAKPMLMVHQKPLIQHHVEALKQAGINDIVINLAWCGDTIKQYLGDGSAFGVAITYSQEPEQGLETLGGLLHALPLLSEQFIVVNGDVYTDYDFSSLTQLQLLPTEAHLVLVENPPHNPSGDFGCRLGMAVLAQDIAYTFSGIALYHKTFFDNISEGFKPLAPLLREKMSQNKVSAELYLGQWHDIGTPERLNEINNRAELRWEK
jgi:MurNAc alpha-1-phosphate uridylyltransferase